MKFGMRVTWAGMAKLNMRRAKRRPRPRNLNTAKTKPAMAQVIAWPRVVRTATSRELRTSEAR
jgi:hypothetical protein